MAVDDAELLALAGGESSDEETTQAPTSAAKQPLSPMPTAGISHSIAKSVSPGVSSNAPNGSAKRKGGQKPAKKVRKDESEEGEA